MSEEMWTKLEKIDILCDRLDLSYEEAHRALQRANGDVVQALADCQRDKALEKGVVGKVWNSTKNQLNRLWQTQVKIKRNDRTVFSVSAPLGIAAGYMMWRRPALRILGLVGIAAAAMSNFELELETALNKDDFESYYHEFDPMTYQGSEAGLQ